WGRKTQHLQMFAILIERSGVEAQCMFEQLGFESDLIGSNGFGSKARTARDAPGDESAGGLRVEIHGRVDLVGGLGVVVRAVARVGEFRAGRKTRRSARKSV